MKKNILTLLLTSTIWSCSTDEQIVNNQSTERIGDATKNPDLYIPEFESGWKGYGITSNGTYGEINETIGIRVPNYLAENNAGLTQDSYAVVSPLGYPMLNYSCYIANGAQIDYSGANDFIVDRVADGIPQETNGDYLFPGMLSITTFQNGLPIGEVIKQSFWVAPTNQKIGFDDTLARDHRLDNPNNMFIWAGTADLYFNKARVNQGKNLIVVEINPQLEINESNYTNNVSTLPVNVDLTQSIYNWVGIGILDLSAISENQTIPPSNPIVTKNFQGANKFINIDFDCPYHEPIYVKHYFTIRKNGVIVADKIDHSEYRETFKGNYRTATYTITTTVIGLGESTPLIVTVAR